MTATYYLRIALPTPLRRLFDYLPPENIDCNQLVPGVRVKVPFQSRHLVGILMDKVMETGVPYGKLKQADAILDTEPVLPDDIAKLCTWAADYYHYPLGEVFSSAMPTLLRKGNALPVLVSSVKSEKVTDAIPELNTMQQQAVVQITQALDSFRTFLLDGVTGSGKTEVYLQTIAANLANNKQVLILIPEISLTPQTIERFRARFAVEVFPLHSGLSERERLKTWALAARGVAKIVIGTRSAIFTPFANLGLIIVDEEHDTSFKQQDRFRYHARDLAVMRANILQIPIVLGSATPSLESLLNVKRGRYNYLNLPERAGGAALPKYELINLRESPAEEGLSTVLLEHIQQHLAQNNQVMLFLNRRGFAPVLYCTACQWIAGCRRCDTRLVYHHKPLRLQCHHCDLRATVPSHCEQCQQEGLQPIGLGTQRLEQVLMRHFPEIPLIRVDRDTTQRKEAMQQLLDKIKTEPKAILLGTQMLAKGHHFPNVTLVGVVDADNGLFSADYRAAEQMGQLLIQVAGRAGRENKAGSVVVQTHYPDHALLQTLIREGYQPFAQTLLAERETAVLPPFSYFAVFRAEAYTKENANLFLDTIKKMSLSLTDAVTILGPVPMLLAKRKGLHCQQLVIRSNRRSALQHFLKNLLQQIDKLPSKHPVKWILDVDPLEMV